MKLQLSTYLWFAETFNANIFSGDWVVWLFIDYLLIKMAFYSDIIINCFKLLANKSANSLRLCERVFPSTWLNCGTVARKQRAEFSDFYYILALLGSTVQWRGGPTPLSGCEQLKNPQWAKCESECSGSPKSDTRHIKNDCQGRFQRPLIWKYDGEVETTGANWGQSLHFRWWALNLTEQ